MAWDIWDPFEDMKRIRNEIEKSFEEFFRHPVRHEIKDIRQPLVDIIDKENEIVAKIELPGVEKKDIDLQITEDMLGVKAEKSQEIKEEKKGFYRHERSYSTFQRAFTLPAKIIPEKSSAEFKNGLLTVTMPKSKVKLIEKKPKRLMIK